MTFRQLIPILSFLGLYITAQADEITYSLSFQYDDSEILSDTINDKIYTRIKCKDCESERLDSFPELPVRYLQFIVPANASNFHISTSGTFATKRIEYKIIPGQPPVVASSNVFPNFQKPNNAIYSADKFYPSSLAKITGEGFLNGNTHIVNIAVYPIQYNPSKDLIKYSDSIVIQLNYSTDSGTRISPIEGLSTNVLDENLLNKFIANKNQIAEFRPLQNKSASNTLKTDFPTYEYCVITDNELAPYFSKLISWKKQKGYDAGIVCIEDILSSPLFANGDTISKINDDAGKLRAYLKYSFESGPGKFVLFGGDSSILPIRYGYNTCGYTNEFRKIPTDLYFADLNGNWDSNQNGLYGELGKDAIDYAPELFVGRLLCKNGTEISNYTEKLLKYELNPGNGDFEYLTRAFLSECDQMQYDNEADTVSNYLVGFGITSKIFRETPSFSDENPTFPTGTDCIEEMERVRYGYMGWHGHGNPGGVGVKTNGNHGSHPFGILALQKNTCYHEQESANGLDNLTNYDYPAISYSGSCSLAPFDKLSDPNYDIEYNVGASFTVGGLYGGPAFLGNTRYGWLYGPSIDLEKSFWRCLPSAKFKLGVAEAFSKQLLSANNSTYNYVKYAHNLIGCPEFEMWTATPARYIAPSIKRKDSQIIISSVQDITGGYIASTSKSGKPQIYEIPQKSSLSATMYKINADPNCPIMLYTHNKIPYIFPLRLQNGKSSDKKYIFATTVKMGANIDTSRSSGNYYFAADSDIIIEASGNVEICKGTEFQQQSNVTINSKTEVAINGGLLRNGATLTIYAPNVIINDEFEVEKGGKLNINNQK